MKFKYIEFAAASLLYLLACLEYIVSDVSPGSEAEWFALGAHVAYASAVYLAFLGFTDGATFGLLLTGKVRKALVHSLRHVAVTLPLMAICGFFVSHRLNWDNRILLDGGLRFIVNEAFLQTGLVYGVIWLYLGLKCLVVWLFRQVEYSGHSLRRRVLADVVAAAAILLFLVFLVLVLRTKHTYYWLLSIGLAGPTLVAVFLVNTHWIIPRYFHTGRRLKFWQMEFGLTFLLNLPLNLIYISETTYAPGPFVVVWTLFWFAPLIVLIPLAYALHAYRARRDAEVSGLRADASASDASLSFLKSQINPHFLFNALNTLYGTALHEKSERTAEGIQKLGDMMRFMLHDNLKDKTMLSRDIDYLENYISLQRLRIASVPQIRIDTQISVPETALEIAPMLLIPFVENAFKHGISLREPSWVISTLRLADKELLFSVKNSIHAGTRIDPERHESGIGLENVRRRLALLYPGKHQLEISSLPTEFNIALTIQLT